MMPWIAIIATLIVSLVSLIGVVMIGIKKEIINKVVFWLVGLSAGTLMGGAFLHLIPEAAESTEGISTYLFVLIGFSLFFIIERGLHWHHCHDNPGECDVHTFTYLNLIGDGVHNFIDGLIIAAAFLTNIGIGITTTLAVIFHEIPQEIGDFAVLIYGGFSRKKAIFYNFLSALVAVLGTIVGLLLSFAISGFEDILVPLTAGGFIYIAASDLIPELHKEIQLKKAVAAFLFFVAGILIMYGLRFVHF